MQEAKLGDTDDAGDKAVREAIRQNREAGKGPQGKKSIAVLVKGERRIMRVKSMEAVICEADDESEYDDEEWEKVEMEMGMEMGMEIGRKGKGKESEETKLNED